MGAHIPLSVRAGRDTRDEITATPSVGDVVASTETTAQPGGSVTEAAFLACESRGWKAVRENDL
jgi:hypothetical protein